MRLVLALKIGLVGITQICLKRWLLVPHSPLKFTISAIKRMLVHFGEATRSGRTVSQELGDGC